MVINNGNGTVTFESVCKSFRFTCKEQFIKKNGEIVIQEPVYNLMTSYKLKDYLHNPQGPAIEYLLTGTSSYWINGKSVSQADGEKMAHDYKFHTKFDSMLEGD